MSRLVKYLILIALTVFTQNAGAQDPCCEKSAGVLPVPMPAEQTAYDYGGWIAGDFASALMEPMGDCPRPVDIMSYQGSQDLDRMVDAIGKACGAAPDPQTKQIRAQMHGLEVDYLFMGTLTANAQPDSDGNLEGNFSLTMQLIDNCPSRQTVVQDGSTSWNGTIADGGGEIKTMGETFMPLDDIIYDYERTPVSCDIQPEKERIKPGETMMITLNNIVDGKGGTPQPWQPLLVKAEKGEILNGRENGDYHVFEVGSGSVEVEYRGPEECPDGKKDKITVENSCTTCPDRFVNFIPEEEIGSKEIEINCDMQIEYNHNLVNQSEGFRQEALVTGSVPFHITESGTSLEGQGTLTVTVTTHVDTGDGGYCDWSGSGTISVTVSGELVPKDDDVPDLNITLNETWYENTVLSGECVDPEDKKTPVELPLVPWSNTVELTFPMTDGHTIEGTYEGEAASGTYSYTLHTNE